MFCCKLKSYSLTDPLKFWESIDRLGPKRRNKIPWEVEINGQIVTEKTDVLNKWKQDFEMLYTFENIKFDDEFKVQTLENNSKAEAWLGSTSAEKLNRPLTKREVSNVCERAKPGKAVGVDKVANELLKHSNVVELLFNLFTNILATGVIPDKWRQAIIHPIPKSNPNSNDPLQYRGLALQCCIMKLLGNILNNRITQHLTEHNLLCDEQNGFRKHRSCQHHIFALTSVIRNRISEGKSTYCAFIDFRKAFNVVDRSLLIHKLSKLGINGNILQLRKELYNKTSNVIRVNGQLSDEFESKNGVKQGDNLSPTSFNCYINGLIEEIKSENLGIKINDEYKLCILTYANDIVLISPDARELQIMLNRLNKWCKCWRVLINPFKSKIVHFRKKTTPKTCMSFMLDENTLELVHCYKYLGVSLNYWLDPSHTTELLAGAGSQALGQLISKTRSNYELGYTMFTN